MTFTTENTNGYNAAQLAELNTMLDSALEGVSADDQDYHESVQAASERILAAYVPPGA